MFSNFFHLRISERLSQWREIRRTLDSMTIEQAVDTVNRLWSSAPYVNYYLDGDRPATWPDPWTLLAENYYCDVAKALGILYTLYFTRHKNYEYEFRIYYCDQDKQRYNLVWIDQGKYILNCYPYEIVNIDLLKEKQLKLLQKYSKNSLELDKY